MFLSVTLKARLIYLDFSEILLVKGRDFLLDFVHKVLHPSTTCTVLGFFKS